MESNAWTVVALILVGVAVGCFLCFWKFRVTLCACLLVALVNLDIVGIASFAYYGMGPAVSAALSTAIILEVR
jgi:hypothetical protein